MEFHMGGINTVDGRVYDDNGQSPDIFQVSIRQNQNWSDRFAYIINGEVIKLTKRKINVWTTSFVIISTETE